MTNKEKNLIAIANNTVFSEGKQDALEGKTLLDNPYFTPYEYGIGNWYQPDVTNQEQWFEGYFAGKDILEKAS